LTETAYIGLGSNLGDRKKTFDAALLTLDRTEGISVEAVSQYLETDPIGQPDQARFLNAAVKLEVDVTARRLLKLCQSIEDHHGRKRSEELVWGPRTLDLDLLLFGSLICNEPDLTIPHPHLPIRQFVLIPLVEIAPNVIHPVLNLTITELNKRVLHPENREYSPSVSCSSCKP